MSELLNLQSTIFLLVTVGYLLKRLNMISKEGQRCITDLVINVILPCNIINAFCMDFTDGMGVPSYNRPKEWQLDISHNYMDT